MGQVTEQEAHTFSAIGGMGVSHWKMLPTELLLKSSPDLGEGRTILICLKILIS